MNDSERLVDRFHLTLIEEIRARRPHYLHEPFTVAEIYQDLVPYGSHRERIGASMNGDYEHALLRLLSGEGDYVLMESDAARRRLLDELDAPNPNTGIFREYAALDVRLNPVRIPPGSAPTPAAASPRQPTPSAPSPSPAARQDASRHEGSGRDREDDEQVSVFGSTHGAEMVAAPSPPAAPLVRAALPKVALEAPALSSAPPRVVSAPASVPAAKSDRPEACQWCREALPKRASLNYCPFCGTDVNLVPCPSCGEELEPEWRFCIACGVNVVTED